jgi:hypothetical protein
VFRSDLDAALARSDRAKGGRPPYDAVLMFKILVLQVLYSLSDDQAEFQILARRSFGRFLGLDDGDPGEPDVTLNPRTEFYAHRAEIEAFVSQPAGGGGEALLDSLLTEIGAAFATDRSLGGLAENLFLCAPETSVLAIEGAAPVLTARITVTIEYLVSDPLAA